MAKIIQLLGTRLILLPERALLLPQYRTLIVADWHLGKAAHFRKAGIFMPALPVDSDAMRLQSLLKNHDVETLVFLGDLFHSDLNSEWLSFERLRTANPSTRFILTRGNHDILSDNLLDHIAVEVMPSYFIAPHIRCTHHPVGIASAGELNIAGHIHPGCVIPAAGKQTHRLPCFYYSEQTLLLPAFGALTGLHVMAPTRDARIYPIAGNNVWEWKKDKTI
ncbi:ligase-associated DNA damage response endonuclease PdeM [Parapedobacter deserti]|uniref:Ligase-associated DNA damage response endonuclease PdeM n=1 Tax=Parapedobacter deserti TaxID=1912957 RepID=A0ABV7JH61_9SPHI